MCPTSNWLTRCVADLRQHPIAQALRSGIPVCINTDDPGIFGVTLPYEILVCREQVGLTEEEVALTMQHALRASFIE
jgi:adenosine deaminase